MTDERREKLATLYDELVGLFELGWGQHGHQAVHFGYYDEDHEEPGSAMVNTTRQLADLVQVDADDRVLDLGCGAGGDVVWLAEERGADVVGVDLVETQLERGHEAAVEAGVDDRVTFWRDDFHELVALDDDSVDVAWALESLSHSTERTAAMERVHEVLAPGGRLAVADVFLASPDVTDEQRALLRQIEKDMGLRFVPIEQFEATLADAGFRQVQTHDVTPAVMPGADRSFVSSRLLGPVSKLGSAVGLGTDTQAKYFDFWTNVYELFEADAAGYYFVSARKGEAD